jgi:two-component system response regulator WspF
VLRRLPTPFPAAMVIVQHVDERFAGGMARWLTQESGVTVAIAAEGDRPQAGQILMAGTGQHLVFKHVGVLGYTAEPQPSVYCPSINIFFDSLARGWRGPIVGVLLTGMGRDGAAGLKALRARGYHTISQDEATSAVYGMPRAAVEVGAAVEVLAVDRIARRIAELVAAPPAAGPRELAAPLRLRSGHGE